MNNWYKKAQIAQTLPYFKEFEEYGDYVPDESEIQSILEDKYNTKVISEIGRGDSGIAYNLSNGDVLKITTNEKEGKIANFLMNNPNKYIIDYKDIWKDGDLYYIIMEKIESLDNEILTIIEEYQRILKKSNIVNIDKAIIVIRDSELYNIHPIISQNILDYLFYLKSLNVKAYDFLNSNNVGIKDGHLVFFDIN